MFETAWKFNRSSWTNIELLLVLKRSLLSNNQVARAPLSQKLVLMDKWAFVTVGMVRWFRMILLVCFLYVFFVGPIAAMNIGDLEINFPG